MTNTAKYQSVKGTYHRIGHTSGYCRILLIKYSQVSKRPQGIPRRRSSLTVLCLAHLEEFLKSRKLAPTNTYFNFARTWINFEFTKPELLNQVIFDKIRQRCKDEKPML